MKNKIKEKWKEYPNKNLTSKGWALVKKAGVEWYITITPNGSIGSIYDLGPFDTKKEAKRVVEDGRLYQ